jgi:hypothetical protein
MILNKSIILEYLMNMFYFISIINTYAKHIAVSDFMPEVQQIYVYIRRH